MGVVWTLTAGADEVEAPAPAPSTATAETDGATPPKLLPWGATPEAVDEGAPGATSSSLAASGADIAPRNKTGPHVAEPEYGPKGYTSEDRTLEYSRSSVPPQPPVSMLTEPVPGLSLPVKYHYSSAYQFAETNGTFANLVIGKPNLADDDYHSLAEIAVQSADGRQIVEVGWTVDRGVNGDEDPHLFVYHWVNGTPSCYNGCGFRQYSSNVVPGDTLPFGTAKRFGIQSYNGDWWIAYDSEWVGYFPGWLWSGGYTKSGLIQWFGEVAASTSEPCSEMGTGYYPDDYSAARVGSISLINGPEPAIQVDASSPDSYYPVYGAVKLSERTFRYGGPGAC